jgi:hypothetical protein
MTPPTRASTHAEQNDGRILSTDRRDFRTYRWKKRKPFKNLLELDL